MSFWLDEPQKALFVRVVNGEPIPELRMIRTKPRVWYDPVEIVNEDGKPIHKMLNCLWPMDEYVFSKKAVTVQNQFGEEEDIPYYKFIRRI
jgi:hypothetical protein